MEFILHVQKPCLEVVKNSLSEFGEGLEIADSCQHPDTKARNLKINIDTEEPTAIFDVCSQFGRIKSVKINEVK
jgi:dihydroxyacetone kinase-like predicted kinase